MKSDHRLPRCCVRDLWRVNRSALGATRPSRWPVVGGPLTHVDCNGLLPLSLLRPARRERCVPGSSRVVTVPRPSSPCTSDAQLSAWSSVVLPRATSRAQRTTSSASSSPSTSRRMTAAHGFSRTRNTALYPLRSQVAAPHS